MEKLTFTVDSALLSELGEKLVEKVHYALVELVKNSYDADARNVWIKFVEGELGLREIQIIDDGTGMNFEGVRKYWMHIATTNKLNQNISPSYGRPKTGSKGIGRFCCRRLGKTLTLITVGREGHGIYEKTEVTFDWNAFVPGTQVTDIECKGSFDKLKKGPAGTTLIITDLSDEWTLQGYNYLKRQLALLVANRGTRRKGYIEDPGFNIYIDAPGFEGDIRDLRGDLINAGWATLKAHINKNHQAVCELDALGIGKKTTISEQKFPPLNDVSLKIGIMIMERDQMRDTNVLSLGSLREMLRDWGGVQVRCRGFRIYPYGDDDWLDIDRDRGLRKTTPRGELLAFAQQLKGVDPTRALLTMSSMDSYVGSVEVGPEAQGFEMKANREGFIDSPAVVELKLFVRFVID